MNVSVGKLEIKNGKSYCYRHEYNCPNCAVPKNTLKRIKNYKINPKEKCRHCYEKKGGRGRKVTLQFKGGRIINANSIVEFCKLAGLGGNAHFHFSSILNGKRLHHKGWHVPDNKSYLFEDVYGNVYKVDNLVSFCEKYRVSSGTLLKLIRKQIPICRGLFLYGSKPKFKEKIKYLFKFKKGDSQIVDSNQTEIARKIGVSSWSVSKVVHGMFPTSSGWKLTEIKKVKQKGKSLKEKGGFLWKME